jgi:hypothetical protein
MEAFFDHLSGWSRLSAKLATMRAHVLAAAAVLAFIVTALAAQTPDPQTLGPKVGMRLQEFSLRDQTGAMRSLRSTFGPKGVVLVFFRSADW